MTPPLIYMDSHATTPCDPQVVEAMLPTFGEQFGNASSRSHALGWAAEALVEQAREHVAALIGAAPTEIVFTSGGTESDNLAIKGVAAAYRNKGRHIITSAIEHHAVLEPCARLQAEGYEITPLPVDAGGRVDAGAVAGAIRDDTILVSIMHANNEIGVIQPIEAIGRICKQRKVLFHTDAVQTPGWLDIDVEALGVDLLSISGHKIHGPKGVGALYVRRRNPRVRLMPQIEGGGQERALRSGTYNVPGIVGLGKAAQLARERRAEDAARIRPLRDLLLDSITGQLSDVHINGTLEHRLPNNLSLAFGGLDGDQLIPKLKGIALSASSACLSSSLDPSHVLSAIGLDEPRAKATLRFGLHRANTPDEVAIVARQVIEAVEALRQT